MKRRGPTEPLWLRIILISLAVIILLAVLMVPLAVVIHEAFLDGWEAYKAAIMEEGTWDAIRLTLITAAIAVPLNMVFGIAAAWCITKFKFKGKSFLAALIDLPFAISPVIAGLVFVLMFGARGWWGSWLEKHDIQIIFATPGIVLATIFITFPFVARELIPLMEAQGNDEEQAARVLGASGWQTFWRVTLPNIKWGLLYGVLLCNARAMGEFGAVYVVSGNQTGQMTVPLYVEQLYNGSFVTASPAFAVASLLAGLGVVTLIVKSLVEIKYSKELRSAAEEKKAVATS
jgi:sulfate transport system permease protein